MRSIKPLWKAAAVVAEGGKTFGRMLVASYETIVDGTAVPNGAVSKHDPDFRRTALIEYLRRAGVDITELDVASVAGSRRRWFYFVTPVEVPDFVSLFDSFSTPMIRDIDAGLCFVVVDCSHQSRSDWLLARIYAALETRSTAVRPSQIILLCGDASCERLHQRHIAENDVEPVRVHHVNMSRQMVADESNETTASATGNRDARVFLCLNRGNELHTQLLVARLASDGLLSCGRVTLASTSAGLSCRERQVWEERFLSPPEWVLDELKDLFPPVAADLPFTVAGVATQSAAPRWLYDNTTFSIVSEPSYFGVPEGIVSASQAVWRALKHGHPVVLFGNSGLVATLNRMGFDLLTNYIPALYDSIIDHGDRFNAAYFQARTLIELSNSDRRDLIHALRCGAEHNRRLIEKTEDFRRLADVLSYYM